MTATPLTWKAAEHRTVMPFPTCDRSLAGIRLRLHPEDEPTDSARDTVRYIDRPEDWDTIEPELLFEIDGESLAADTGVAPDAIVISVICRDRRLCKFEKVKSWPLRDVPRDAWSLGDALRRFSRSTLFDLVVVATPQEEAVNSGPATVPAWAALATKTFSIRSQSHGLDFPFKLVEPDALVRKGLDRRTIYYVHWVGEDPERPPGELLEVWLNKDLEDKFHVLSAGTASVAAEHVGRNIAAGVYAEVLAFALETDAGGVEPTGLVAVVGDLLEEDLGVSLEDARQQYASGPGGRAKLIPWSWKIAKVDEAFAKMRL